MLYDLQWFRNTSQFVMHLNGLYRIGPHNSVDERTCQSLVYNRWTSQEWITRQTTDLCHSVSLTSQWLTCQHRRILHHQTAEPSVSIMHHVQFICITRKSGNCKFKGPCTRRRASRSGLFRICIAHVHKLLVLSFWWKFWYRHYNAWHQLHVLVYWL